jgi:uncharacterized protein
MIRNETALITGATSGIGRAFAHRLAREGCALILHGRREPLLSALCDELQKSYGVKASYVIAELADPAQLLALEERIRNTPDLTFLVNNAGFGIGQLFENADADVHEAMIRTHMTAPVRLSRAALPAMLQRKQGSIVNVSSVASFMISPASLYCATKAGLTNFSESLDIHVRDSGVRVQALCPGFTRSDFHQRMGIDTSGEFFKHFMSAEAVVDASMRALRRGKVVCIPGVQYKFAVVAQRLIPRAWLYGLARFYRRLTGTRRGV